MAALDENRHLPVKEREQQRADVGAIDVGVRVVATKSAHAGDEVFIALDREVIDIPVAGLYRLDAEDGQGHQITAHLPKIPFAARTMANQVLVEVGCVGVIPPDRTQHAEILLRGEADDPVRMFGHAGLTANLTRDAVGFIARHRRDGAQ